ncbi:amino acid ABC transporter permease [uncultured Nitratireductor sp.]|uniref:amino acid ABC transporter permease n=1 Tax=uncultured Nitratireductor sp. TaxID=520953 RepID=UPI0025EAE446|nr:amino acid ABC transporter permease [uncultured Nitratireductor sp.]
MSSRPGFTLITSLLSLLAAAGVVYMFATSQVMWDEVLTYLTAPAIFYGIYVTVGLTILSMFLGIVLGVISALMSISPSPIPKAFAQFYVWLFRGIPLLVLIIFCYNFALFAPRIGFGEFSVSTNVVMTSFTAAVLALSLHEGAYMSEIVRGGILSVDKGQIEAARALGISRRKTFRRIVLPQALTVVIPATGNQTIGMLKATSLVSVIGVHDLLTQAQFIYTKNYLIIELLIVAVVWYLGLAAVASLGQRYLEHWISSRKAGGCLVARAVRGAAGSGEGVIAEVKPS